MVVEGIGSFGFVVSSPRIPFEDENVNDITELEQVSKILYEKKKKKYIPAREEEINSAYANLLLLIEKYTKVFNSEYFVLPIKGGYIDKHKFVKYFNDPNLPYGFKWLSNSIYYFDIMNELILHKNKIFQISYEKGSTINYDFMTFQSKMSNVFDGLVCCKSNGFYLDDIKYSNLVVHKEQIKIIDFEEPINTNLETKEYSQIIQNSKLHCVLYFPYDTISNILLFEYIGSIDKIGKLKKNNYYKLLLANAHEFIDNVNYKVYMFDTLVELWNEFLPNLTFDLEVIDLEVSDINDENIILSKKNIKIDSYVFNKSIKILFDGYFLSNIFETINDTNQLSNTINKIFDLNKKFIELVSLGFKNKITHLLTNTNIYSFGFIFLDWLIINKNNMVQNNEFIVGLKHTIEIVVNCCLNFLIINEKNTNENKIYLLDRNYSKLKNIMTI